MKRYFALPILLLLLGPPASGQGCAMCKANAAAMPSSAQRALRHGILALLLPTLGVVTGLGVVVWKHRE